MIAAYFRQNSQMGLHCCLVWSPHKSLHPDTHYRAKAAHLTDYFPPQMNVIIIEYNRHKYSIIQYSTMLNINRELHKKIVQVRQNNPSMDEDALCEQLFGCGLRMKQNDIRNGVKEYLKKSIGNGIQKGKSKEMEVVTQLDRLRKKVKRAEFVFQFEDDERFRLENMGGVSETLKDVEHYVLAPLAEEGHFQKLGTSPYKGFLIAGPNGSGKTFLCNCILSILKNKYQYHAYCVQMSAILGSDGEDKLKKVFEACRENQPAAVVLDDIDVMFSKENSKRPQGSLLPMLMGWLDRLHKEKTLVFATCSSPEKLQVSLRKLGRLEKTLNLDASNEKNRQEVLWKLFAKVNHSFTTEDMKMLSSLTSGFMAGDLVVLLKEAGLHTREQKQHKEPKLTLEHFKIALKYVQPMMKKQGFTEIPDTTLEDVGGLHKLKKQLEKELVLPIKHQEKFKEINFSIQSGGVLLYGPPGCGKTMLAKAIANAIRANFIIVNGPQLLNKYVGESEQAVREVFGRAQRAAPCIIFFDEFDALAPKRSDQGNQVTQRVVNTLLTSLDGVEERKMVFVIAATNRKQLIDQATLRAGRIQKHLYVPEPNLSERIQILKAITRKMKVDQNTNFEGISANCEGFSGADLKMLIREATVRVVLDDRNIIEQEDLQASLEGIKEERRKGKQKNYFVNEQI